MCSASRFPTQDAVFVKAYPTEALEAIQDGHNEAYAFFAGVPPWCLYDNMSTAVKAVTRAKTRDLTDGFLALRSHYLFTSQFCNVGRPNERGGVERLVGYVRRNFLVPIPRHRSWADLNIHLLHQCRRRFSLTAADKKQTIGALLQEERDRFLPLSPVVFEACRVEQRRATSLSLVRFQGNSYSVPVDYAYREVTVKACVSHLTIGHREAVIARHERCYGRDEFVFNPVHYLPLLERKPGALGGARPFTAWALLGCFETLRRYLEARNGNAGTREYILILQLLRDFPVADVRQAMERALQFGAVTIESVKMLVLSRRREPSFEAVRLSAGQLAGLPKVYIAAADPSCYRALLAACPRMGRGVS